MFSKRKATKGPSITELTARLRGFVLDSQIPEAHQLAVILGCSPISDDVAAKEEEESDRRVDEISALTPLLYAFAHALAEASVEHQKTQLKGSDKVPDEVWMYSRRLIEQVSISVLLGATAQMVDMKLLTVNKKLRRLFK